MLNDNIFTNYKFVVILSKNLPAGVAINAASHMVLGLLAKATEGADAAEQKKRMSFIKFVDANNIEHYYISALSLIVLRATNSEIKKIGSKF